MSALIPEQTHPGLSRILGVGCLLLAISTPLLMAALVLLSPDTILHPLNLPPTVTVGSLNAFQRVVLAALAIVPTLFESYGLLCARRCFQSFARCEYFDTAVVDGLRGFGGGVFLATVVALSMRPIGTLLLTLFAPAGKHTVSFGIDSGQLLILVFTGILWQIAGVISKAISLVQENRQFV
jgi:hypothetical protein